MGLKIQDLTYISCSESPRRLVDEEREIQIYYRRSDRCRCYNYKTYPRVLGRCKWELDNISRYRVDVERELQDISQNIVYVYVRVGSIYPSTLGGLGVEWES